ncbi:hypothetical protein B0I35DRAFT_483088 [Stachybotrys elegans]|uniref:Uncharacterized protein n=1 Tax=Stachybotrys elegans TaxID=80388 RepID=A0A8K0WL38_9HYPO|nr:hypothetical protein B0I35DRAFT_483088 [Stachybotrys elegans]
MPSSSRTSYSSSTTSGRSSRRSPSLQGAGVRKWQCCRCAGGPFSISMDEYCLECHSHRCEGCYYSR